VFGDNHQRISIVVYFSLLLLELRAEATVVGMLRLELLSRNGGAAMLRRHS
jgi:hypothetical protein